MHAPAPEPRRRVECAAPVNTELLIRGQLGLECRVSPVLMFASLQRHPERNARGFFIA